VTTLVFLLLVPTCQPGDTQEWAEQEATRDIRIVNVANAGFLVVVDGKKVLIDALFSITLLAEPPPEVLQRLETGQAPFDSLDLILATHNHSDHFRAESVLRALAHSPNAVFLSTPQAVSELETLGAAFTPVQDRILTVGLPVDSSAELDIRGLRVRVTRTGHGSSTWVENYMYLVSSYSASIFHEGDGEVVRVLDRQRFGADSIDVAFIQTGLLTRPEFLRRIESALRPRHMIPIHISADDREYADEMLGRLLRIRNNVHYLREPLSSITIAERIR